MILFKKILTTLIAAAAIFTFCTLAIAVNEFNQLDNELSQIDNDIRSLASKVKLMEEAVRDAEEVAIQTALEVAPQGKSIYQLRGDAQTEAQRLLDKLTDKYEMPRYQLSGIRFRPSLRDSAAGTATGCEVEDGIYIMTLNEILFLRNYEEFMHMIIPHEVAHIVTCLQGGFEIEEDESPSKAAHGEEWRQVMLDIGFLKPEEYITHHLDMTAVIMYDLDLARRLDEAFERGDQDVSEKRIRMFYIYNRQR